VSRESTFSCTSTTQPEDDYKSCKPDEGVTNSASGMALLQRMVPKPVRGVVKCISKCSSSAGFAVSIMSLLFIVLFIQSSSIFLTCHTPPVDVSSRRAFGLLVIPLLVILMTQSLC